MHETAPRWFCPSAGRAQPAFPSLTSPMPTVYIQGPAWRLHFRLTAAAHLSGSTIRRTAAARGRSFYPEPLKQSPTDELLRPIWTETSVGTSKPLHRLGSRKKAHWVRVLTPNVRPLCQRPWLITASTKAAAFWPNGCR
jgi:hypothetical protein